MILMLEKVFHKTGGENEYTWDHKKGRLKEAKRKKEKQSEEK